MTVREVKVTENSDNPLINSLLYSYYMSGTKGRVLWNGTDLSYSFHTAGVFTQSDGGVNASVDWTEVEKVSLRKALAELSAVSNLTFTEISSEDSDLANIDIRKADMPQDSSTDWSSASAYAYLPSSLPSSNSQYNGEYIFNDVVFPDTLYSRWGEDNPAPEGSWIFNAQLHEFGHRIGLAHPHSGDMLDGITDAYDRGDHGLNCSRYTVMSYKYGATNDYNSSTKKWTFYYPSTFMVLDIAAIQYLYGADMTAATGNNIYKLDDVVLKTYKAIWDAAGNDTMQYDGSKDVVIDLRAGHLEQNAAAIKYEGAVKYNYNGAAGYFSGLYDGAQYDEYNNQKGGELRGGYYIAKGVVIENATGGAGNDRLIGNEANNIFVGRAGNDTYVFNFKNHFDQNITIGHDTIIDTQGSNIIKFNCNITDIEDDLSCSYNQTKNELEISIAQAGYITIKNWVLSTGSAISSFEFIDIIYYADSFITMFSEGIGKIIGNQYNNTLIGTSEGEKIYGLAGNDVLIGGGGADLLDGGEGNDYVSYRDEKQGVIVDLNDHSKNAGAAKGDILVSIENVKGTEYDDAIHGLKTSDGYDKSYLYGYGGNDILHAGNGSYNYLYGGDGNDYASYKNATQSVIIDLNDNSKNAGAAKGDVLVSIENAEGTEYDDIIYAHTIANTRLYGHGGEDRLYGGDGDDYLKGGADNDRLYGYGGNDLLFGGYDDGSDYLYGHSGSDRLSGYGGNDYLYGGDDNDHLNGGDGNDYLNGGSGRDHLWGKEGNDRLYGDSGNDYLDGGTGNDYLSGGSGNDAYIFTIKEGYRWVTIDHDTIVDTEGNNIIKFNCNITYFEDDLSCSVNQTDNELEISIAQVGYITIKNWVLSTGNTINSFTFNDITYSADDFVTKFSKDNGREIIGDQYDNILTGTDGDDNIYGLAGNDTLIGGGGTDLLDGGEDYDYVSYRDEKQGIVVDLNDNAKNAGAAKGDVLVSIENIKATEYNDVIYGSSVGANTYYSGRLYGYGGDDRIYGGNGIDRLYGGGGDDYLYGYKGNDYLSGSSGNDTLTGGTGDDRLYGSIGTDTYIYHLGDGSDLISDIYGNNVLQFSFKEKDADISCKVNEIGSKKQLLISIDNEIITIDNWHYTKTMNSFVFTDKTYSKQEFLNQFLSDDIIGDQYDNILEGTDGDDKIYALEGNDILIGGKGADLLDGGEGIDTAKYNTAVTASLEDPTRNLGEAKGDTYHFIENLEGSNSKDALYGDKEDNSLWGNAGDDYIYGRNGDDHLYGGTGNDSLSGDSGNDTLTGDAGDDHLYGGSGNDTYIYHLGDGSDYVADSVDENILKFAFAEKDAKISCKVEESDNKKQLIISIDNETITLDDWHDANTNTMSSFVFTDKTYSKQEFINQFEEKPPSDIIGDQYKNTLIGTDGDDKIYGLAGNDTLIGGGGADLLDGGEDYDYVSYRDEKQGIIVNLNDNSKNAGAAKGDVLVSIENVRGTEYGDAIYGSSTGDTAYYSGRLYGYGGNDRLYGGSGTDRFFGGSGSDRIYGYSGNDYLYGDSGNDYLDAGYGNDYISGSRGNDRLYGSAGNDYLYGGTGYDYLSGGSGNDYLHGSSGSDYLYGGSGADDYVYYLSHDKNTINDYATDKAKDQLFCKFDLSSVDLSLSWSDGDDLLMDFGSGSSIKIIDWKRGDNYQIEEFVFNDGTYNADQFLIDHGFYA